MSRFPDMSRGFTWMWKVMDNSSASGLARKASIKETGEEISQEDWARFDAAVAEVRAERERRDNEGTCASLTPYRSTPKD